MKRAIFPGSFDPFHEGHDFVVQKGLEDFDLIYIVISWNENKERFFSYFKSTNHDIIVNIPTCKKCQKKGAKILEEKAVDLNVNSFFL